LACALVEQESGGANVFGCDKGAPFCHQEVTYSPECVEGEFSEVALSSKPCYIGCERSCGERVGKESCRVRQS
jgi:hypothetical protein